jgi:hypothetical protein
MLKISLAVVALLISALLIYAATKPDSFTVQRTVSIQASPQKLHALINAPREFDKWSPYNRKDPQMSISYSGPASGVGARTEFSGNKEVGKGSTEIVSSNPPNSVAMKLNMIVPFKANNDILFSITPQADGVSQVTWAMSGAQPFIGKLVSVFINIDKMVGKDFEEGLNNLRALAEKA